MVWEHPSGSTPSRSHGWLAFKQVGFPICPINGEDDAFLKTSRLSKADALSKYHVGGVAEMRISDRVWIVTSFGKLWGPYATYQVSQGSLKTEYFNIGFKTGVDMGGARE